MTSFSSEGGEKVEAKDGGTQSGDGRACLFLYTGSTQTTYYLQKQGGDQATVSLSEVIPAIYPSC